MHLIFIGITDHFSSITALFLFLIWPHGWCLASLKSIWPLPPPKTTRQPKKYRSNCIQKNAITSYEINRNVVKTLWIIEICCIRMNRKWIKAIRLKYWDENGHKIVQCKKDAREYWRWVFHMHHTSSMHVGLYVFWSHNNFHNFHVFKQIRFQR